MAADGCTDQIWYGEDLEATGGSQSDNVGTACVDVYYYTPETANTVSCIDIPMLGTASSPHEYSPETVSSKAFDDDLGTWWDGCCEGCKTPRLLPSPFSSLLPSLPMLVHPSLSTRTVRISLLLSESHE